MCIGCDYDKENAVKAVSDFGCPFVIYPDGRIEQAPAGAYGYTPEEVEYLDQDEDGNVTDEPEAPEGWEYLTGRTGQYGYNGAVMHPSEYIGGGLLGSMLLEASESGEPQVYVAVVIDAIGPEEDAEPESMGWALAHWVGV